MIKNYQNSLITTKKNIILNFIFEKYFIAHQKQYSQLITKNKKAQEELSTLKNILLKHILYIDNYENVEDLFTHKKCTNMFYQQYKYNVTPKTFPYLTELSFTGDHPLTDYLQNVFDCKNENEIELDTCLNYFKNFNCLF